MATHASRMAPPGIFVTGTDTGVGKTLIACALIHAIAARGRRVVGMKPVAAGAPMDRGRLRNEDVERLNAASRVDAPLALVNPYCFEPAIAPSIAARAAGVTIKLDEIVAAYRQLAALADHVIVEGVGGFCVPLNTGEDGADLARHLGLPVLLVVGLRLGCLNHALLTAQAIRSNGLGLAGWCANQIDPAMACVDENISVLSERLNAPLVGRIGRLRVPDAGVVAGSLDLEALALST
jgi:dethiobiotin synthetase